MALRKAGALALCAALLGASAQNPMQLLREAADANAHLSYTGQVQHVDFGKSRANAVLFRIEHRAPDLTRRWYLAPDSVYGDSIVNRGDMSYDVDTHAHRIIVSHNDSLSDQVALDDNFGLLERNYRPVLGPGGSVAGRKAIEVILVNRYTGQTVMRVEIDAQTKLVLQKERYSSSGSVTHQIRFENIQYTNNIPLALFTVPSSGYVRMQGVNREPPEDSLQKGVSRAGFKARWPRFLPEGFVPVAAGVSTVKGIQTLHLLYSDGLRTISLFENARGAAVDMSHFAVHSARLGANTARYVEDGPTTLVAWHDDRLHYALVGAISHDELLHIAASVAP